MSNDNKKTTTNDSTTGFLRGFRAAVVVIASLLTAYFVYTQATDPNSQYGFKLGLDLAGGSHLVYEADVSKVDPADVPDLMNVLRDVIERRVNIFGVSEPIVQVESSSFVSDEKVERLVVELPGVTDVTEAVSEIGKTPLLEFKLLDEEALMAQEQLAELNAQASSSGLSVSNLKMDGEELREPFMDTGLTGRYLQSAALEFAGSQASLSNEPIVSIVFNDDGAQLFEEITRNHTGENLAIFLDGEMISSPRINEPIAGGRAIISGGFTPDEARDLAQNLNFGALPVPIALASTQTVGASLGGGVLDKGIEAGVIGFSLVVAFMLLWYRVPGAVAAVSLVSYVVIMLALFMFIPVTLTAAGLAGFILSLGMAVDANVLVFERMKEEYRAGQSSRESAQVGFARAWSAIRDGNVTSLLSAIILFWFGTSIVKGFALVFGIGVLVSMFSAIVITRTLLISLPEVKSEDRSLLSRLYHSAF